MKVKSTVRAGGSGDTGTGTGQQGNHNQTLVLGRKSLKIKSGIRAGDEGTFTAQAGGG